MRTLESLRNTLLDIIPDIRSGKLEVGKANAICSMTNSIINLTKLEVDYYETNKVGKSEFILSPLDNTIKQIEEKNKEPYIFEAK